MPLFIYVSSEKTIAMPFVMQHHRDWWENTLREIDTEKDNLMCNELIMRVWTTFNGELYACDETGLNATWISNSKKKSEGEITRKGRCATLKPNTCSAHHSSRLSVILHPSSHAYACYPHSFPCSTPGPVVTQRSFHGDAYAPLASVHYSCRYRRQPSSAQPNSHTPSPT